MPKCTDCGKRFKKKKLNRYGRCESCEAKREAERAELRARKEREWRQKKEEGRKEGIYYLDMNRSARPDPSVLHECNHVTGIRHHEEELRRILSDNPIYDWTKKELGESGYEAERIYQYELYPASITLQKEPDNPVDSGAIKVIINNEHIGYIKRGSTAHVANLLNDDRIISASATFGGGKYKIIDSDYDCEKERDVYYMTKDESAPWIDLDLYLKPKG